MPPRVSPANAMYVAVYVEIYISTLTDVPRMARLFVQFLLGIVPRPEAEWLQTADAHGAACGGKCEPSHITTVVIVLRTHIVRHEITQRHGIITYVLREFPVRIVLIRVPAVRHFPRRWAYLLCHLYRGDVCPHRVAMVKGVPILWRFSRNARLPTTSPPPPPCLTRA